MAKVARRTRQSVRNNESTKSNAVNVETAGNNSEHTENDATYAVENTTHNDEPMEIDALASIVSDFPRKYTCHECGKDFSCGSSLKRHLLDIHEQEIRLKFGRTYKGGRAFSNHRYYLKHRKLKESTEKTEKQLSRIEINQRAYQKRVFKKEAEALKQDIITSTKETLDGYKDAKDLRKKLKQVASKMKAFHRENMYLEIQRTLGFADTFDIQYSIAFYFILAIANRLPNFINLNYDKKEVAFGLCWQTLEKDGVQEGFECDESVVEAMFASLDNYFLETNPCYLLRSLFSEPLIPLPPSPKKNAGQDKQPTELNESESSTTDKNRAQDPHDSPEDDSRVEQKDLSVNYGNLKEKFSVPSDHLMEDESSWPSSNHIEPS
ncbi:hypothetical protein BD408DRAFT_484629 [Parasitella parasitica]|nr:hypothetical protein BD408DRAFT_484629 [Parasitella parasitica]